MGWWFGGLVIWEVLDWSFVGWWQCLWFEEKALFFGDSCLYIHGFRFSSLVLCLLVCVWLFVRDSMACGDSLW